MGQYLLLRTFYLNLVVLLPVLVILPKLILRSWGFRIVVGRHRFVVESDDKLILTVGESEDGLGVRFVEVDERILLLDVLNAFFFLQIGSFPLSTDPFSDGGVNFLGLSCLQRNFRLQNFDFSAEYHVIINTPPPISTNRVR